MARLYNLARMHTATLGPGALIDLGNAVTGFLTFALAGVTDGTTVSYAINDPRGGGSEVGSGVYHSSGPSFTRTTVEKSSDGTSRISLSVNAEIMITPAASDLNKLNDVTPSTTDNVLIRWNAGANAFQDSPIIVGDDGSDMSPSTSGNMTLGTSAKPWGNIFLASGKKVDFGNGDVSIIHATNSLSFFGATSGYNFDAIVYPSANDGAPLGDITRSWSDLFLASGGVINWANGAASISHVASNVIQLTASNSIAVSTPNLRPVSNDSAALGNSTDKWSDLFLASGGVINWNNGDATLTHGTKKLAVGVNGVESAYWETPGTSTYTPASGSVAGHYIVDVGNALNPPGVTGQFFTPGIGPFPSSGLTHIFAKYNDSSAGNISNIFSVAYNQGTRYTAGITGIAVTEAGATGTNLWGGQFSAVFRGSGAGIGQGANIECDFSTGTGTYIGATIKLGDSEGGVTVNAGNSYINMLADTGKTPVTGIRFQSTAFTSTNTQSVLNVEGGSAVNGIDLSSMTITGSSYKGPGFAVNSTGIPVFMSGTAIPAGGTNGAGLKFSSTALFGVFFGSGAPSLSAAKGSLYLRSDGSGINDRIYVNSNGSTTWTAAVTVA